MFREQPKLSEAEWALLIDSAPPGARPVAGGIHHTRSAAFRDELQHRRRMVEASAGAARGAGGLLRSPAQATGGAGRCWAAAAPLSGSLAVVEVAGSFRRPVPPRPGPPRRARARPASRRSSCSTRRHADRKGQLARGNGQLAAGNRLANALRNAPADRPSRRRATRRRTTAHRTAPPCPSRGPCRLRKRAVACTASAAAGGPWRTAMPA